MQAGQHRFVSVFCHFVSLFFHSLDVVLSCLGFIHIWKFLLCISHTADELAPETTVQSGWCPSECRLLFVLGERLLWIIDCVSAWNGKWINDYHKDETLNKCHRLVCRTLFLSCFPQPAEIGSLQWCTVNAVCLMKICLKAQWGIKQQNNVIHVISIDLKA